MEEGAPHMQVVGITTRTINSKDSIFDILNEYLPVLEEGSIIAVTSKIISICEQRVIPKDVIASKYELVKKEAEAYLAEDQAIYGAHLTIKNNILIPSAGIDESNSNGHYILYPENPQKMAEDIWHYLQKKHHLSRFGVVITDSHVSPLRRGVTGVGIAWCGFEPLYDYIGKADIFDETLRITKINILDALATAAVFIMGEGAEKTPLAIIRDVPRVTFVNRAPSQEEKESVKIPLEEDLFAPLLRDKRWIWNQ